jgi:hypothetical protein
MPSPRWLPVRRRPQQPHAAGSSEPPPQPGPRGFWLTDPDFRARLHSATLTLLDIVEDCMNDDIPLTEVLNGARFHAEHMLGIPVEYGVLVEAEAAAQIAQAAGLVAGSPFGDAIGQALTGLEQRPVEEQQQLVRAAARRYAITTPPRPRPAPAVPPPAPKTSRSR